VGDQQAKGTGNMANWDRLEFDFDSDGNIIYIGKSTTRDRSTADPGWYIIKIVWQNNNVVRREKKVGSWDNRNSLGWL
jgi:hypothetical protein